MLKYHIQTVDVGSGGAASIDFYSIPQIYDDIFVVISARTTGSGNGTNVTFNGNTSGYTSITLQANGSSTSSYGTFNRMFGNSNDSSQTATTFGSISVTITGYSSNLLQKKYYSDSSTENNGTTAFSSVTSGIWDNASPIRSISLSPMSGFWVQNSSASIYGVRRGNDRATSITPVAVGGTVTTSGGHTIHTFTGSGTFSVNRDISVEYLVVAGGGGGGKGRGGGGGAGGYLTGSDFVYRGESYPIVIGAGGNGGAGGSSVTYDGRNGNNSGFGSIVSVGGGGGQGDTYPFTSVFRNGGSGGGANLWGDPAGTGIPGQGNDGGYSPSGYLFSGQAGGGGGAGAPGGNVVVATQAGAGGVGLSSSITGSTVFRSGGGGGGADGSGTPGAGGTGGGGAGSNTTSTATSGTSNTGGGGGGGWRRASDGAVYDGGAGGSGIVIIRYLTP